MPNDDSRAEGDNNEDKGSRRREHLEPWYVLFLLILFFYTHFFLLLFSFQTMTATSTTTMNGANTNTKLWQQGRGGQWRKWGLKTHIASWALVFFFLIFFILILFHFIHFRPRPPHLPQPLPPLPCMMPMTMQVMTAGQRETTMRVRARGRISSQALVCFLLFHSFIYLFRQTTKVIFSYEMDFVATHHKNHFGPEGFPG